VQSCILNLANLLSSSRRLRHGPGSIWLVQVGLSNPQRPAPRTITDWNRLEEWLRRIGDLKNTFGAVIERPDEGRCPDPRADELVLPKVIGRGTG
jgi:hypothetical protein